MGSLTTLAQALGIAYASGINLYATVALVGLGERMGWIGPLPESLAAMSDWWVIAIATVCYIAEFLATLVPGVASAWETVHTVIRPPAAAALAVATAWHGDPVFVLIAALLGGGLALTTHTTKLGLRYAIDTSPEPLTNGVANVAELGLVASIAFFVWSHPFVSLAASIAVLIALMYTVRLIWRSLGRVFSGRWMPECGLRQGPRASARREPPFPEER